MGLLKLIQGSWDGKVGQLVGAKWKDKATLRSYTKPANPDTPAQQSVRGVFGEMSSYVATFADGLRGLSTLDTRSMSIRNAIVRLNKSQIDAGAFSPDTLVINKGGLPNVADAFATQSGAGDDIVVSWTKAEGSNISAEAQAVVVAVDTVSKNAFVGSALNTAGTLTIPFNFVAGSTLHVYVFISDKRKGTRVGSLSAYTSVTLA